MEQKDHFNKIFWFIVGVVAFGAYISIYAMQLDKTRIDIVLTFWLSTAVSGCIGYLIGASANQTKGKLPTPTGTTTIDLTATQTSDPMQSGDTVNTNTTNIQAGTE